MRYVPHLVPELALLAYASISTSCHVQEPTEATNQGLQLIPWLAFGVSTGKSRGHNGVL